jgi:uroporphyrinogen-III synthase
MLCYVVGEKTAAAAREAGFDTVRVGDGDARSMADLVVTETVGKGTVAYLAGRVRLSAFEEALQLAGLKVFPIDVYDTESVEPTVQDIQMLKAGRPIDAVLIYSARAADAVQQLSHRPDLHEAFSSVLYCCISHRVAAHFDALDSKRIRVADRPEEAAIFALLHE